MRLIDADELKKAIMLKEDVAYETWNELYDSVLEEIDNAPTAEPENERALDLIDNLKERHAINNRERGILRRAILLNDNTRSHGKWIDVSENIKLGHGYLTQHDTVCSVCKASCEDNDGVPQKHWKFCPNCGADMREDSEK